MGCESDPLNEFTEWFWQLDQSAYGRPLFEEYPRLDVRHLNRSGLLQGTHRVAWSDGSVAEIEGQDNGLEIVHRPAHYPENLDDHLCLTWTPCNFGGHRPWFICPGCGERIAVLYAFPHFRCRACHPLAYGSTHRSEHWPAGARSHGAYDWRLYPIVTRSAYAKR